MQRTPRALAAAALLLAGGLAVRPADAATPTPTGAKTAAAQTPVLTCGPTSTPGIWGCWNNVVGKYTITFPSTAWCPTEDSCRYNYHGPPMQRADIRHTP